MRRFQNKRFKRRRYGRKRQGTNYFSLARKAFSLAKYVASVVNVETKFIDTTAGGVLIPAATPTIVPLTLCSQGVTDETRNGNSIKAKSNSLKFNISINPTNPTDAIIRCMLVLDKVSNGTVPSINDILDNVGGITETLCHYNGDNMGSRFKVLADKRYHLDTSGKEQVTGSIFRKLGHHVKYDGPSNAITDATTGHLYFIFMSNISTVANQPDISYTNRFYFIDN